MSRTNLGRRMIEREPTALSKSVFPVSSSSDRVEIGLSAAVVAVIDDEPRVLLVEGGRGSDGARVLRLPSGAFSPASHVTLEAGIRSTLADWAPFELRGIEQLLTLAERPVVPASNGTAVPAALEALALLDGEAPPARLVSIGYLALARPGARSLQPATHWVNWYDIFPWEDWRKGRPRILSDVIEPRLRAWAESVQPSSCEASIEPAQKEREHRMALLRQRFGLGGGSWDVEKVVERLELIQLAGLLGGSTPSGSITSGRAGTALEADQLQILASAIARLRTRIKSQPVVFELLDDEFTLFELQKTVEAVLGPNLHKQNFRRLVSNTGLVEATREVRVKTGGRPARLYRPRGQVNGTQVGVESKLGPL